MGYNLAHLEAIVRAAGVTKVALYHHFPGGKPDLFRAVLRQVHEEVASEIASAASDADPWTQLVEGCRAFLSASTSPSVRQIMLLDALAVLRWDVWREFDAAASMPHLAKILDELMQKGIIADQPVGPVNHLLSGAMNEAAMWLAHSKTSQDALDDVIAVLARMLEISQTAPGSGD